MQLLTRREAARLTAAAALTPFAPAPLPLQDCHLLTQSEDFEGRVAATADENADCGKEREDE